MKRSDWLIMAGVAGLVLLTLYAAVRGSDYASAPPSVGALLDAVVRPSSVVPTTPTSPGAVAAPAETVASPASPTQAVSSAPAPAAETPPPEPERKPVPVPETF